MYLCVRGIQFNNADCYLRVCTKPGKSSLMYFCVRGIQFNNADCYLRACTKLGKSSVMYLYVRGIQFNNADCYLCVCTKPGKSSVMYLCVRGIQFNNADCYLRACTKPGKSSLMYLCVRGIVTKPVPSQECERSCTCVLGVSLPSLYQARNVSSHVFVCQGYRYQACTKPGKLAIMYKCVRGIDIVSSFYHF